MLFEKGTVATMTSALFCDECGAALPTQATSCAACGHLVDASSPHVARVLSLPPASSATLQRDFMLAQRYRIAGLIGQGGFAQVYKASDTSQGNRLVAIKQISLRGLSAQEMIDATATYNREILFLSQLRHESLPRMYEHFTGADHWYIVMEYIEGESLEDSLKSVRGGHFSVQKVLAIGLSLCKVLDYLHHQQYPIIFRDLKPANIMMTRKGRLYLIDFGIARRYWRPQQRKDTAPLGSPGYAAPEQYGKEQTTSQTDIYGLGATLQTLLTGKEPLELLVSGGAPDHPLPKKLQALISQMLERDPGKRPRSMEEVKQSLQQLRENSFGQKTKRTLAYIWHFIPLAALLLFIYSVFSFTGFFSNPLWIPGILAMLCTIVGRSAMYLYREMKEATTRPNAEEVLVAVSKQLKGSILYALIPAIVFYFLYGITRQDYGLSLADNIFLGSAVVFIIGCLYSFNWKINRENRSPWHLVTSWRRAHKQKQSAPLQQQMQKRP